MTEISESEVTDRDVFVTRAFNAPRDVVWKFFTQRDLIAQWFGPTGITVPLETVEIELTVGGKWVLTMVDDASGEKYPIDGVILVCEPPEFLEIGVGAKTAVGDLENIRMRLQFHDHGEKTRVTLHQGPFTDEQREQTEAGWELSFGKLDALLALG
ncbi:MAG TPA: SRPBCC domain-containing protein [Galbitalea sp.]|jgi:uncharacterized protein YndB with AHSA1/START domain